MIFRKHFELKNKHAFLSPSNHSWMNYSPQKLRDVFLANLAKEQGTRMHDLAKSLIELGVKLPKSKKTFNLYVNDAIGFRMTPEVPLFYSDNCFGTADSITFDEKEKFLRIHDLKTGKTQASMNQLIAYAALFCLEYGYKPSELRMELRIYQMDEVSVYVPEPNEIADVIDKIKSFDDIIRKMKDEAGVNAL